LADACDLFRNLLNFWLCSENGMRVVGATGDGREVLKLVQTHKADLLIMDPLLPGRSGFEIAAELQEKQPFTRILAVYQEGNPYLVEKMRTSGFHGCLCKNSNALENFRQAVCGIMNGGAYFCEETCRVQNTLYNDARSFARILSNREQDILRLIGQGLDNNEIGHRLTLSPATVQTHRRNLFRKLGIHDTPSLMRYALEQGFWHPYFGTRAASGM
jgi:DNA-binding NarL/FixJ family response regulator